LPEGPAGEKSGSRVSKRRRGEKERKPTGGRLVGGQAVSDRRNDTNHAVVQTYPGAKGLVGKGQKAMSELDMGTVGGVL